MQLGKPSPSLMADTILRLTGAKSESVNVGPKAGVDVSVLDLGDDRVLVASCDPVSLIPSIGPEDSAGMSLREVASDVATSGHAPKYVMFDLNLPPRVSNDQLRKYWASVHKTCVEMGLSILGGHTGRFEGCDYSVIGSATMWVICRKDQYLTSSMARDGDDLILTKSAAFGATSVLTRTFPRAVRKTLGTQLFRKAWKYFLEANTVKDALTAVTVGIHEKGVTAMHDATEGGVIAAIMEMTKASQLGAVLDLDNIFISEETRELCKLFHIDPLISLGEGSLLIASRPIRTSRVIRQLTSKGVRANVAGRLSSRIDGVYGMTRNRRVRIGYPTKDPYWEAYWKAVRKGWS